MFMLLILQHWNDMPHPDLLMMASRLMHHLGKIMEENVDNRKSDRNRMGIDRKLAGKVKAKKKDCTGTCKRRQGGDGADTVK